MSHSKLLTAANLSMVSTLALFLTSVILAYGFDHYFSLIALTFLHISQIVLAASFKLSYVVRLVAQDKLGMSLR